MDTIVDGSIPVVKPFECKESGTFFFSIEPVRQENGAFFW